MEMAGDSSVYSFVEKISPEKFAGMNAVIQIEITGKKEDVWHISIRDGVKEIVNSRAESPTIILTCDAEDFSKLVTGKLDIMRSFMTGKLRITGDMAAAMKLASLFG